ncbi:MAG TPA: bifunctional DedA family/phosphatase PAP2 family protein [Actinomycetes bacterium]|nr:bifunctional DedA family/phosphatase PAP2 family protein [Actinomycetes bacterium]
MGQLVERILGLHGWAVLAVVFLLPALEASAFLGVVIPGEVAVLLGGVLAFQHRAWLPAVLAAAVAGAILGDSVGYLVGRRFGRRILDGSVGRLVRREHLDRAERYLAERGGPAVFFGRFTAALRALIPGLAGMAGLRYRTFAAYNAAGGALWASGFVLLGYLAGTSWRQVEQAAKRASLLLLLALLAVGALVLAARWLARHPDRVRQLTQRQLQRPVIARLRTRYRRQLAFLARRLRPGGALGLSLTVSVLAVVGAGWAFGAILQDVLARDELELIDQPVASFFVGHREAWLTRVMRDASNLGSTRLLLPLIVVAGVGWWLHRRSWRPLALLVAAFAGAELSFVAVKQLVGRPRPPAAILLKPLSGPSFPSGHATQAVAVYGTLAALAAAATPRWSRRVAAWTLAVLLVGLVGVSRLYLGTHWLTDVLGGLALGAVWLFALLTTTRTLHQLRAHPPDRPAPPPPDQQAAPRANASPASRPPSGAGDHG